MTYHKIGALVLKQNIDRLIPVLMIPSIFFMTPRKKALEGFSFVAGVFIGIYISLTTKIISGKRNLESVYR